MVERFVLKGMRIEPDPGEYWVATRYVYATAYDALAADLAQAKARIASLERRYMDLGELAARYREALVKVKDAKLLTVAHIAAMDALGIDWYRGGLSQEPDGNYTDSIDVPPPCDTLENETKP